MGGGGTVGNLFPYYQGSGTAEVGRWEASTGQASDERPMKLMLFFLLGVSKLPLRILSSTTIPSLQSPCPYQSRKQFSSSRPHSQIILDVVVRIAMVVRRVTIVSPNFFEGFFVSESKLCAM